MLNDKEIQEATRILKALKEHMQLDTPHIFDEEIKACEILLASLE